MVPRKGLEPSRLLGHWHLKPARLPIPPPGPGPVTIDRSRACQIGESPPDYPIQGRSDGVGESTKLVLGKVDGMVSNLDTLVTVFGGSGFVGRHVVRALAKRDYRIRVAVRRPELAGYLQPLGRVGQVHCVQANVRYPASVEAAMRDSHIAINLVAILTQSGAQTFDAVQVKGAETVAKAAASADASIMVRAATRQAAASFTAWRPP